jgi:hypothetical protein
MRRGSSPRTALRVRFFRYSRCPCPCSSTLRSARLLDGTDTNVAFPSLFDDVIRACGSPTIAVVRAFIGRRVTRVGVLAAVAAKAGPWRTRSVTRRAQRSARTRATVSRDARRTKFARSAIGVATAIRRHANVRVGVRVHPATVTDLVARAVRVALAGVVRAARQARRASIG